MIEYCAGQNTAGWQKRSRLVRGEDVVPRQSHFDFCENDHRFVDLDSWSSHLVRIIPTLQYAAAFSRRVVEVENALLLAS